MGGSELSICLIGRKNGRVENIGKIEKIIVFHCVCLVEGIEKWEDENDYIFILFG